MNSRERVLTALGLKQPDRVPFVELLIDDGFVEKLFDSDAAAIKKGKDMRPERDVETEKKVAQVLGLDNIVAHCKPPVMAEQVKRKDGRTFVGQGLIKSRDDIKKIQLPDPHDESLYESVKKMVDGKGDLAACASTRFGTSNTWMALGLENFIYSLMDDPSFVEHVLSLYTEWTEVVVAKLCKLDIDVLILTDDICDTLGPYIPLASYRNMVIPKYKRVAEKITKPSILHCCGNFMPILDDILDLGIKGINPIQREAVDINMLKQKYGSKVCLVGNIDMDLLANGTPEEVESLTRKRIEDIAPGGGYMVSSGNSFSDYCRVENVRALADSVRKYGSYPISC